MRLGGSACIEKKRGDPQKAEGGTPSRQPAGRRRYEGDGERAITRLPASSRRKLAPGGTTVVALYSVTTAGPEYFFPTNSSSRECTRVVSLLPAKTTLAGDPARRTLDRSVPSA